MAGTPAKAKKPLVYSCSGCSNVAQLCNHLAVRLDRSGVAFVPGFDPAQSLLQAMEALAVVPGPGADAAADPAGKLSAWLLSQADLASGS